jgi:hypothetical protein
MTIGYGICLDWSRELKRDASRSRLNGKEILDFELGAGVTLVDTLTLREWMRMQRFRSVFELTHVKDYGF